MKYTKSFQPVLFDTKGVARHDFLEFIGYWNLMKTLNAEQTDREKISEVSRDILNTIKEKLEPLYVGNFEYGAPIPASTRDSTWPPVQLSPAEISQVFKWRLRIRSNFKKSLKNSGLTLEQGYKIIEENTGEKNVHWLKRSLSTLQKLHKTGNSDSSDSCEGLASRSSMRSCSIKARMQSSIENLRYM